ncbi:MAG: hypothetical protein ACRDMV_19910 [Streptosporangiales bacterium]
MSDVISHGPDGPRWRPPRWLGGVGIVVVVAAVVAALALRAGGGGDAEQSPVASGSSMSATGTVAAVPSPTVDPNQTAAVMLSRRSAFGHTLDQRDHDATKGPWAAIVRRDDGSLGRHGAVVTYPVSPQRGTQRVAVGDAAGTAFPDAVVWPLHGHYARIRGDLGREDLIRIAAATRVVHGRPWVRAPDGYTIVFQPEPYRSPHVREAQYGPAELIAAGKVNGVVYTALARGAAFEDRLYAASGSEPRVSGSVRGHPAVLSSVGGGNATLAWESAPGVVAYVGYSGTMPERGEGAMLHGLADRTLPLSIDQWRATHPAHVTATNNYT